ncbi:SDR family oxidoreductase [Erwinia sp. E_sp_B04_7]|uniref:SDR family oxidoreductase n=1 Tax=unclassified Erwinia TaxID=2622719 RepID=UPI0030CF70B4
MRIFLTGATGFIGSAVAAKLIAEGCKVTGLTRSQQGAEALTASGIEPYFGDMTDLESLRRGAMASDAVIHTAFNHDFTTFTTNCEMDRLAIEEMAGVLKGTPKPLLITSVVGLGSQKPGAMAVETHFNPEHMNPRKASELAGVAALSNGTNVSVIRLSQVHNTLKQGLITPLVELAREKGVSAYIAGGENRWSAVHVSDAASLYILALKRAVPGSRYHAVAEQGITLKAIAGTIGRTLNVPVKSIDSSEASEHFGWLSKFVAEDMSASSAITQEQLKWHPKGASLLTDLEQIRP